MLSKKYVLIYLYYIYIYRYTHLQNIWSQIV